MAIMISIIRLSFKVFAFLALGSVAFGQTVNFNNIAVTGTATVGALNATSITGTTISGTLVNPTFSGTASGLNGASINSVLDRSGGLYTTIIGNRAMAGSGYTQLSNGTDLSQSSRRVYKATFTGHSLRLVYGNHLYETSGTNGITVKAAIEDSSNNIYPVYFNGSRTRVIDAGGIVTSDPVGFEVTKGDTFYIRTQISVDSGNTFPKVGQATVSGDRYETDVDKVDSGTMASTSIAYIVAPDAVIGTSDVRQRCVVMIGDSIMAWNATGLNTWEDGWAVSALGGADYGKNVPHIRLAVGGRTAATYAALTTSKVTQYFLQYATHAIIQTGINDLRSGVAAATVQASMQTFYDRLNRMGIKVWQTTITPESTSSDSWATVNNQTAVAYSIASRLTVNTWIRTTPSPLSGYIELADTVESARDSGKWKAGYTSDGLHPNSTAGADMRGSFTDALFTLD
jgi:lysophospholipase L1-like esterase